MRALTVFGIVVALAAGALLLARSESQPPAKPIQIADPPAHFRSKTYPLSGEERLIVADVPDVLSPQLADRCFIFENDRLGQVKMSCLNGVSAGGQ